MHVIATSLLLIVCASCTTLAQDEPTDVQPAPTALLAQKGKEILVLMQRTIARLFDKAYQAAMGPEEVENMVQVNNETVTYDVDGVTFTGYLAYPSVAGEEQSTLLPGILVLPDATGLDAFEQGKAESLASLGYYALAVDLFGNDTMDASTLAGMFLANRTVLMDRLVAAAEQLRQRPEVDPERLAAVGFGLGGLAALDMARANVPGLKSAISLHGPLHAPAVDDVQYTGLIKPKVMVATGYMDQNVGPEQVLGFQAELESRGGDWQLVTHGNGTQHAFSVPLGGTYHPQADRRSWLAMRSMLDETLGQ